MTPTRDQDCLEYVLKNGSYSDTMEEVHLANFQHGSVAKSEATDQSHLAALNESTLINE